MSWVDYFQNATRLVNKKINSKAQIINYAPEYFTKLTKLVQEYNKTTNGKMYVYHARCMSEVVHTLWSLESRRSKENPRTKQPVSVKLLKTLRRSFEDPRGRREWSIFSSTFSFRRILNNYLVWQTVRSLTGCLSKPFRDAYKGLRKALIGSEGNEEQWRYCVSDVNNAMGFAIGAMFVREVFHGKSKPMVSPQRYRETSREAKKRQSF